MLRLDFPGSLIGILGAALWVACSSGESGPGAAASGTATGSGMSVTGSGSSTGAGGTGGTNSAGGMTSTGGAGGMASTGGMGGMPMSGADCSAPQGAQGNVKLTTVASNLVNPIFVAAPPVDDTRLFVVERAGRIQLVKNGVTTQFLDISAKVNWSMMGERGLFAVAFHPDYASNRRFFVTYTSQPSGNITVEEYARDANNPDVADPGAVGAKYIDVAPVPSTHMWHNGGGIAFSPNDKLLYVGLGESGTVSNAQDKSVLLGKLLRFDVSTNPYTAPPGNLAGAAGAVHDYGLRNPWRISFDVCTGDRYIGDVGGSVKEEVDVAGANEGPVNWGWPIMEGAGCKDANCNSSGLKLPAADYAHSRARCSVTGGYVYRGSAIPWLRGAYIYGDLCTGEIFMFRWKDNVVTDQQTLELTPTNMLVSFGQDNQGAIYAVHMQAGTVSRLDPQ